MVAYPDRDAGNDPKLFFFFFFFLGGGGGGRSFITKAQHFYNGQYGSNDLPRPRRSALSEVLLVSTTFFHYISWFFHVVLRL